MPDEINELFSHNITYSLTALAIAALAGYLLGAIIVWVGKYFAKRTEGDLDNILLRKVRRPLRIMVLLMAVLLVIPYLRFPDYITQFLRHLTGLLVIAGMAWLLVKLTYGFRDSILRQYPLKARDNLKARAIHTQVNMLVKFALIIILIVALSSALITFEKIRQVGVSLLASAGIAGIIIGFAAQKSLATMFAGIQIAITQPIRIDDVVIVENEWGKIEEITLTYVVVAIWDLRRLVLPITYFIERPFQNWTRVTADLLGTVFLRVDYTVPIEEVRQQLHKSLEESKLWDGKVWNLQVTEVSERTVELRCLMSAEDASTAWDLRCEIREKLLVWLQKTYPEALPKIRANVDPAPQINIANDRPGLVPASQENGDKPGTGPRTRPRADP